MPNLSARQRQFACLGQAVPPVCLSVMLALTPTPARAQEAGTEPPDAASSQDTRTTRARQPTRLYFGMWTLHLRDDAIALRNNWTIGVASHGFFGATLAQCEE